MYIPSGNLHWKSGLLLFTGHTVCTITFKGVFHYHVGLPKGWSTDWPFPRMEKYRQFADGGATDADRHCCFQNRSNKQVYNHRAGANHRDDSVDDDDEEEKPHFPELSATYNNETMANKCDTTAMMSLSFCSLLISWHSCCLVQTKTTMSTYLGIGLCTRYNIDMFLGLVMGFWCKEIGIAHDVMKLLCTFGYRTQDFGNDQRANTCFWYLNVDLY